MNQNLILLPVIVQAFVTLYMYVPMSKARLKAVKDGKAKPADFALPNISEGEETRHLANAVTNQFELPVLFFAACIGALAAGLVDWVFLAIAFLFVGTKTTHSFVHATTNRVSRRRRIFIYAWGSCILLWLWFAVRLIVSLV